MTLRCTSPRDLSPTPLSLPPHSPFLVILTDVSGVTCGCFTKDGGTVCTGGEDGSVRVWAPVTGKCSNIPLLLLLWLLLLLFWRICSANVRPILSDPSSLINAVLSSPLLHTSSTRFHNPLYSTLCTHSLTHFITSLFTLTPSIFSLGKCKHTFEGHFGHEGMVTCLASSSDGELVLSGKAKLSYDRIGCDSIDGKEEMIAVWKVTINVTYHTTFPGN